MLHSVYLHVALLLLALTWHTWSGPCWWDLPISVLPNLLGFTLGGFAIFLGFGDEKFRQLLAERDEDQDKASIYVTLCAAFVHFIVIQVLAILSALVAKALWFYCPWPDAIATYRPWLNLVGGAAGYGLFLYAITLTLAATMSIFRTATWYEMHQRSNSAQN